ncbi:DUSAM domain-containing protein [Corallococcus sp. M34]|nr:DUSAM domain-containing protein [Citreicoccus inhibens]
MGQLRRKEVGARQELEAALAAEVVPLCRESVQVTLGAMGVPEGDRPKPHQSEEGAGGAPGASSGRPRRRDRPRPPHCARVSGALGTKAA